MKKAIEDVKEISSKYGLFVDPMAKVEDITVGMQQRVEILKALYRGAETLILDEPTAVLTPQEITELINIIRNLTNQGKSVIIITHKLKEIKAIADHCTVIRRGKRVEILKALYRGAETLILDEPTAVLTPQEITELINIIRNLTNQGKSVIIITHKLKEIKAIADHCTVIRRGKYIDTVKVSDVSENDLAEMMVGREVNFKVDKDEAKLKETVLKIDDLIVKDNRKINVVDGLSLEVKAGEILGIAGIDGNGQSELVEALTGLRKVTSGIIEINGETIVNKTPKQIFNKGIKNIPEDRQKRGLVLNYTIAENVVLQNYKDKKYSKNGILDMEAINKKAKEIIERFDVRPTDYNALSRGLSGGNQQKVIIGREVTNIEASREVSHEPQLLIATQPTRGLDVGAIEFVHKSLVDQRDAGNAVLLVSLELDEVMNVSDRIAVIYEGKIVGIVDAKNTNENELGMMMAGGDYSGK